MTFSEATSGKPGRILAITDPNASPLETTAHTHTYDLGKNSFSEERAVCTVCRFSVPLDLLRSRGNLDAIIARKHATQRLRDLVEPLPCR